MKALWGGHTAALQFMLGIQQQIGERKHAKRNRRLYGGRYHEDMHTRVLFLQIVSRTLNYSITIMRGAFLELAFFMQTRSLDADSYSDPKETCRKHNFENIWFEKASQGIQNMKFGSCNLHFSCKLASMATKFNFLLIMIRRWQVFSSWLGTGYCFLNTAWCHIWGKNGARVIQKALFEAVWVAKKWYVWCNLLKTCLQNCAPHRGRKHNFEKCDSKNEFEPHKYEKIALQIGFSMQI